MELRVFPRRGGESYIGSLCRIRDDIFVWNRSAREEMKNSKRDLPRNRRPPSSSAAYPRLEFIMRISPEQTSLGKIQLHRSKRNVSRRTIPISTRPLVPTRLSILCCYADFQTLGSANSIPVVRSASCFFYTLLVRAKFLATVFMINYDERA